MVIAWSGWSTSGQPLEWLVHQWTSNGVAGPPDDLTRDWWRVQQLTSPWSGWFTSGSPMEELVH